MLAVAERTDLYMNVFLLCDFVTPTRTAAVNNNVRSAGQYIHLYVIE